MLFRSYYKWLHREIPKSEQKNRFIADEIEKIHTDSPDKGYRRIRDDLERYHGIDINDKMGVSQSLCKPPN